MARCTDLKIGACARDLSIEKQLQTTQQLEERLFPVRELSLRPDVSTEVTSNQKATTAQVLLDAQTSHSCGL